MALVDLVNKKSAETFPLLDVIDGAEASIRKARRHRRAITGSGFYARKFTESNAEALIALAELQSHVGASAGTESERALEQANKLVGAFFDPKIDVRQRSLIKNQLLVLYKTSIAPAIRKGAAHAPSDNFFPLEIVQNTRSYIEKIAAQACGCYDLKWYDGAAVMARRLLETLIIEVYEKKRLDHKIKNKDGTFQFLSGLISVLQSETTFNIGRNAKRALPALKDIGDQSAHNRRYIARQQDLDGIKRELRVTIEELVHLAEFK